MIVGGIQAWHETDHAFADWLERMQGSPYWSRQEWRVYLDVRRDQVAQARAAAPLESTADQARLERAAFTARMEQVGMQILNGTEKAA